METPCIQRACAQAGEAAAADAASAAPRALRRAQVLLTRLGVRHLGGSRLSLEEQRAYVALQSERVPAAGAAPAVQRTRPQTHPALITETDGTSPTSTEVGRGPRRTAAGSRAPASRPLADARAGLPRRTCTIRSRRKHRSDAGRRIRGARGRAPCSPASRARRAPPQRADARAGRRSIADTHRSYLSPKGASEGAPGLYRRPARRVTL